MDTQGVLLFLACLLFGVCSSVVNSRLYGLAILKIVTLVFGFAGFAGAGFLLVMSLLNYIK